MQSEYYTIWNVAKSLSSSWSEAKYFVYFVATVWEWILLTAALTNWTNFQFAQTAKNVRCKVYKQFEKCQRYLSTFANV